MRWARATSTLSGSGKAVRVAFWPQADATEAARCTPLLPAALLTCALAKRCLFAILWAGAKSLVRESRMEGQLSFSGYAHQVALK